MCDRDRAMDGLKKEQSNNNKNIKFKKKKKPTEVFTHNSKLKLFVR